MLTFPFSLPGFQVQEISSLEHGFAISAHSTSREAVCPSCGQTSQRLHSFYTRSPHDVPLSGQTVQLHLRVRRFRCQNQRCSRQTFVERLPEVVPLSAQRTTRFTETLTPFAMALSSQVASRLLMQIGMNTSADTLLRLAKRSQAPSFPVPKVLGVDDFAFHRGHTYGTIFVDLQAHRPIDLLPQRSAQSLADWLQTHPGVETIVRDRSLEYTRGATMGAPDALQVVDRWHVLKNMQETVQRIVKRVHHGLKEKQSASGVTIRPQYKHPRSSGDIASSQAARQRRLTQYEQVITYAQQGKNFTEIAQRLHISAETVSTFVHAGAFPEWSTYTYRNKTTPLDPYLPYLQHRVQEGCENATLLWQEIRTQGFPNGYKSVNIWLREYLGKPGRRLSPRKQMLLATNQENQQVSTPAQETTEVLLEEPVDSPRHLSWLLVRDPSSLQTKERQMLTFICQEQTIGVTYNVTQQFVTMVREQQASQLDSWLQACQESNIVEMQAFGKSLQKEYAAMKAALTLPYSNGPVEGQVNRLKLIKRSMYGRGSFELLRQRVLHVA